MDASYDNATIAEWIRRLRRKGTVLIRCNDVSTPWRLYEEPRQIFATSDISKVMPFLMEIDAAVEAGAEACGYLAYEAAGAMDEAMEVCTASSSDDLSSLSAPLLWFGIYDKSEKLSMLPIIDAADSYVGPWIASRTAKEYGRDFARIKDYITAGETYQINYTIRLNATFHGNPYALFYRLYRRQPTALAAFLNLGSHAICSVTPELFFEKRGSCVIAKPMKGTRPTSDDPTVHLAHRAKLAASEKDRAENTMIVDMIRNDLGRVARLGSVTTPSLFDIEEYPTVWQMTSTVQCQSEASVSEILATMFPCASITGAPKIRSMKIIRELEKTPRGIYTGTIGRLTAESACFRVAIRTAWVDLQEHRVGYGCGGGIVWDSQETAERDECYTKAKAIMQEGRDFELLETMLYRDREYDLLSFHLDRLAVSAQFFGFSFDKAECMEHLDRLARTLGETCRRIRLLLTQTGQLRLETSPCPAPSDRPWKLVLASLPVDSTNPFLCHKTTHRTVYDRATEQARAEGQVFDDVLLFNERGEVTETTIANLLVQIGDRTYTPPVESGLLPGTLRRDLLERGAIEEQTLTIADVQNADALFLINSVRGRFPATLYG